MFALVNFYDDLTDKGEEQWDILNLKRVTDGASIPVNKEVKVRTTVSWGSDWNGAGEVIRVSSK